jgi:hypothetical protein
MSIRGPLQALACCLSVLAPISQADESPAAPSQAAASAPAPAGAPTAAATGGPTPVRHIVETGQTSGGPGEPGYSVSASWVIAGYNDNEVIYSIIIANNDANVIRCTTLLSGYYLDHGTRHAVADRQSVTLFPGKQSSAGTWLGLDQASGASYKVTCRAVH